MATETLWVNSFDATVDSWDKTGASPYLSTQNQPTDYVSDTGRNNNCGYFGFQTSSETGTINSVTLYMYADAVAANDFEAYINDTATGLNPPTSWGWVNVDVSSILTSWAEINAATLLLDRSNTTNLASCDAAYLEIDYDPPASVEVYVTHQ